MKLALNRTDSIWVVDDNIIELKIAEKMFQKAGIHDCLKTISSGKECLELINDIIANNSELPTLILLDLNMPLKNGFDVLKQIRRLPNLKVRIPVIIFTNSSDIQDKHRAMRFGANDFITKPASPQDYLKLINELQI